jgi:hypothetical protein
MQRAAFFARMAPEFARQASAARENAGRQADVARLLGKAEYEFDQMCRELSPLMAGIRSLDEILDEAFDAPPLEGDLAPEPSPAQ